MSLLRFEHVRRDYPAPNAHGSVRTVLRYVNLTLEPGEVVALIGRSGAGKTTLLHLAAGLCRATDGRILLDDTDLSSISPTALSALRHRRIGLVFQNNLCLNALPVWENVALPLLLDKMGPQAARCKAEAMLDRVGLASLGNATTASLSGGQRRRLGLARALIHNPPLLLADEPTADLDEETAAEIQSLLGDWLAEGKRGVLIVTHGSALEALAQRTIRLEDGRLSECKSK